MVNGVWQDKCMLDNNSGKYVCSVETEATNKFVTCEEACPLLARRLTAAINPNNLTHPMCLEAKPGLIKLFPKEAQIQAILDTHNALRSTVSVTYRGTTNKMVPAADLSEMKYDFALARLAQRWAENNVI